MQGAAEEKPRGHAHEGGEDDPLPPEPIRQAPGAEAHCDGGSGVGKVEGADSREADPPGEGREEDEEDGIGQVRT